MVKTHLTNGGDINAHCREREAAAGHSACSLDLDGVRPELRGPGCTLCDLRQDNFLSQPSFCNTKMPIIIPYLPGPWEDQMKFSYAEAVSEEMLEQRPKQQ